MKTRHVASLYVTQKEPEFLRAYAAAMRIGTEYIRQNGSKSVRMFVTPIKIKNVDESPLYGIALFGDLVPELLERLIHATASEFLSGPCEVNPQLWTAIRTQTKERLQTGSNRIIEPGVLESSIEPAD